MVTSSEPQCPHCGKTYPDGAEVCPACHGILSSHRQRRRTPAWVIALLAAVIVGLMIYIVILCRQNLRATPVLGPLRPLRFLRLILAPSSVGGLPVMPLSRYA